MKKIKTLSTLIAIFIISSPLLANDSLDIIESTNGGVTINYEPVVDLIDTIKIKNETYLKINCNRNTLLSKPGEPLIPTRIVNIGIPLKAEVDVNIISTKFRSIEGKLLPAPDIDREGTYSYKKNQELYAKSSFYPEQILSFDEPVYIRDQRVLPIKVNTIQFEPAKNRINILDKIEFRINFKGIVSQTAKMPDIKDDEFYHGLITNYSQSKKWLKEHPHKMALKKSFLESDAWYKIEIKDEGIYKISGSDLVDKGVDIGSINPKTLRIYNNGGKELPRNLSVTRPDSLIENSIRVIGEDDSTFNNSDYILFYGRPVEHWDFISDTSNFYEHYINHYTDKNVYWLTWGGGKTGKRIENKATEANSNLDANYDFWGRYKDEDELNNFLESGLDWFGRLMAGNQDQVYSLYLPFANNVNNNVYFKIRCLGLTSGNHRFSLYFNNEYFAAFSFTGNQLYTYDLTTTLPLSESGYNNLKIQYNGYTPESQVYLDWIEAQYRKQYSAENNFLWFSQFQDGPQKYRITNFTSNQIDVYDISDWQEIKLITNTETVSGAVTFVDENIGYPRHQYIAVSDEGYQTPVNIEQVTFANLRALNNGADFIVITHDDFFDAVLPLKQQREEKDNLKTEVVKISDIYNEFSWGLIDVTAMRDFIKYAYENWNPSPKYILLCGDGDYDYKNIKTDTDKNWLPPYQTTELNENTNRTSDDWFVTVSGYDSRPDLAIGRFPVQSAEETENVVEKILNYENTPYWNPGQSQFLDDWRNVITMVGDDEFGTTSNETMHIRDAEYIIEHYIPNSFEKEKIYLIEYPAEKDPSTSGIMKPAATEDLLKRINNGTLILNYVGHGAPPLWAHERVLKESRDFELIQNENKLPFWLAATCDFGRFDDPLEQGLAEKLFTAKGIGGIAFLASARLAYASDNTALNRQYYEQLFTQENSTERIGIALLKAKVSNYSSTNDQKYHIYGDPTMRLVAPKFTAIISSVEPDTLKALSEIKVSGYVYGKDFEINNFEGKALLKVLDSRKNKIYTTAAGSNISYVTPGNTIFKGTLSVNQGQFTGKFIVPKDISYGGNLGRISLYFADEQIHGIGYRDSLPVGGTSILSDAEGPIIKIGFQGQDFIDGSLVGKKSILEVEVADSISGVNIVGDIGHNITMVLDDNENDKLALTDYFNYFEGNYKAGKVVYDFASHKSSGEVEENSTNDALGLSSGNHKITIKAWDNFNNSTVTSAYFTVVSENVLEIKDVFNYPNPFTSNTTFTFITSQNCDVKIKIYTVRGTMVQTLDGLSGVSGPNQIYWDGRDREGDIMANGVYLYKIIAVTENQDKTLKAESIGKLVIAR